MTVRKAKQADGSGGDGINGPIPFHRCLTVAEVAELACASKSWVRRAAAAGRIPRPLNLGVGEKEGQHVQLQRWDPIATRLALGLHVPAAYLDAARPETGE